MKRFAFLSQAWPGDPNVHIAGSSVQVYYIALELACRGYPVLVLLTDHPGFRYSDNNLQVISVDNGKHLRTQLRPVNLQKILDILRDFQPDIIYQRGKLPESVAAAIYKKKYGSQFIWLSNADNSGERWKFVSKRLKKRKLYGAGLFPRLIEAGYADLRIERAIQCADLIISQTVRQQQDLKQHFHLEARVLGSGHPIPPLAPKNNPRPKVLWLANLTPMKQPIIFARLAAQMYDDDAEFIMAGKAPNPDILKQVLDIGGALPNFKYLGGVGLEEGNRLFKESDIFVSTSLPKNEGLPNTFIQAFIHGVPVLSLNHDPDQVITDHKLGAVVSQPETLIQELHRFIDDTSLRRQTGHNAYQYALRHYNIHNLVDELLAISKKSQGLESHPMSIQR